MKTNITIELTDAEYLSLNKIAEDLNVKVRIPGDIDKIEIITGVKALLLRLISHHLEVISMEDYDHNITCTSIIKKLAQENDLDLEEDYHMTMHKIRKRVKLEPEPEQNEV